MMKGWQSLPKVFYWPNFDCHWATVMSIPGGSVAIAWLLIINCW